MLYGTNPNDSIIWLNYPCHRWTSKYCQHPLYQSTIYLRTQGVLHSHQSIFSSKNLSCMVILINNILVKASVSHQNWHGPDQNRHPWWDEATNLLSTIVFTPCNDSRCWITRETSLTFHDSWWLAWFRLKSCQVPATMCHKLRESHLRLTSLWCYLHPSACGWAWLGLLGATMGWIDGGTCLESDGAVVLVVCWQHDECRNSLIQEYMYNVYNIYWSSHNQHQTLPLFLLWIRISLPKLVFVIATIQVVVEWTVPQDWNHFVCCGKLLDAAFLFR